MVCGLLLAAALFTAGCARTELDLDIGEAGKIELYSSTDYSGWRYLLNWYDERNQLMEKVVVLSETRIEYEDYFYEGEEGDGRIDLARLDELLDAGQAAN